MPQNISPIKIKIVNIVTRFFFTCKCALIDIRLLSFACSYQADRAGNVCIR